MTLNYSNILGGIQQGNTASRPTDPDNGLLYYNTELTYFESFVGGAWFPIAAPPAVPTSVIPTNAGTGRAYNNGSASIAFTPSTIGGYPTSYIVTPTPATSPTTFTAASSPIVVTGLASSTQYTYVAQSSSAYGTSGNSTVSSAVTATTVPQAPTIGAASAAAGYTAQVTYTAGATGGAVATYTATSTPGSLTGTGTSPITVAGLTNGTAYTFTVTATNANGTSLQSAASNSITAELAPIPSYLAVGNYSTPYIYAASFSKGGGVSSAFANPASLPANITSNVEFNSDSSRLAYADNQSPYLVYNYGFSASGFGTKSASATLAQVKAAGGYESSIMNKAKTISIWGDGNFRVVSIPFTGAGFGTGNVNILGGNGCMALEMNSNDTVLFAGGSTTQLTAVNYSNSTYAGTAFTAPASMPASGTTYGISINSTENVVAFATVNLKNIYSYAWSNSTGWGTKYTDTVSSSSSIGRVAQFSGDGNYLFAGCDNGLYQFPFSVGSGFGTRVTTAIGATNSARFNTAKDTLAVTSYSAGFKVYPWTGTEFGTRYSGGTLPTTGQQRLAFSG